MPSSRPLAIVTGASTGIGYELALQCAERGFDLMVAADEPAITDALEPLRARGAAVEAVEADLATIEGVDKLYDAVNDRPVEALLANAGRGLGRGFLDQDFNEVRKVIDTNHAFRQIPRLPQRVAFGSADHTGGHGAVDHPIAARARRR